MLRTAELRWRFWDRDIEEEFAALKAEAYYDIIKELIFAHLYRNGYDSANHLCLIAYLREMMPDFGFETDKIDELRRVRNNMNYKGLIVEKDYLRKNEREFRHIITELKERLGG